MFSSMGIVSVKVETKSKIFEGKFWTTAKCESVSQSQVCVLASQKNAKMSHCVMGQLDTNLSPI